MRGIVLKPMISSITTIPNYPHGACLISALLSSIRTDFPLFTLKSHDESMKRRKWRVCRKAGRESSKAPRGHSWTVVIEDIKGYTTITRMRGGPTYHTKRANITIGVKGHIYTFCAIFWPQHGGNRFEAHGILNHHHPKIPTWCLPSSRTAFMHTRRFSAFHTQIT